MKKLFFLFTLSIFLTGNLIAQHCPFDGGYLVAVHLTDKNGKPVSTKNLTLVEINNPVANSCTYAEGLLRKSFLPTKQTLQTKYAGYWKNGLESEYKGWTLLNAGYYAVGLNMSENSCMIKKDNDFTYRKRQFEIHYLDKGVKQKVKVPREMIYSLCTNGGKWTRIIPIEIKK
jgi:hypothetical protein